MTQLYRRSRSSKRRKIIDTSKVFISHYCLYILDFALWSSMLFFFNLIICDCDDMYVWKEAAVGTAENAAVNLLQSQGLPPW